MKPAFLKPRFFHACRKFVVLSVLAITPVALAADRERVKEVAGNFICICGCNQLLTGCNHLNCPNRGPMLDEVAQLIDQGKSEEEIIAAFSEKYGLTVLSSPPTSGFNLTAWVTPFAALAIGAMAVAFFARRFRARWRPEPAATAETAMLKDRVEEELHKYTPED